MPYLIVLAALLGLLCILNLVFTYGVIIRLREHSQLLAEGHGQDVSDPTGNRPRPMGDEPSEFSAVTLDGETVSRDSLTGPAVIAFLSPGCVPCEKATPEFLSYAGTVPEGRDRVTVVISGFPPEATKYAAQFTGVGRVIVEEPDGPVQSAFAVNGFPAFAGLDVDGAITVSSRRVADLPTAVSR
ncbi:hypothetical protein [Streptomyces sp. NPDC050804]|uniref:TlpA family protein disulfide reductase n=1 Tax=Streptomyces sp. NPDC050804 TaxID=3154745 RepID=UPI00343D2EB7